MSVKNTHTVKDHLLQVHGMVGKFSKAIREHSASGSEHATALAGAFDDTEIASHFAGLAKAFDGIAAEAADLASRNDNQLTLCDGMMGKAAVGMNMDEIVPDNVRGIYPITAVPRTGQPTENFKKTEVPLELERVLSLDDGEG
jgi:hypothetical protein